MDLLGVIGCRTSREAEAPDLLSTVAKLLGLLALYELVRFAVVRRVRRLAHRSAVAFVRQHRIRLESARFIDQVWIREALAQDPVIEQAILEAHHRTGEPPLLLRDRADAYAEEIAPYFSLSAYYRFGAAVAKRLIDFLFEVDVEPGGFERQMDRVPPDAVRVYVINHRANIDPAILAYGLLHHVPMSYAVGEWALVWPLDRLFRAFGSYFVRRGESDPLYHAVLERFVQIIAGHGAVTGFFIEGGLSRDGALRRPRTGLLGYLIKLRREHPDREIAFMPVGLNYDRVFEDRILTREADGPLPNPTALERLANLLGVLFWVPQLVVANLVKAALRSHRKFGYAAIRFGEPLLLSEWPGGRELHLKEGQEAEEALEALGEELLNRRIGDVVPAVPVAILCEALRRPGPDDHGSLIQRMREVVRALRAAEAPFVAPPEDQDDGASAISEVFDAALDEAALLEDIYRRATLLLLRRRVLRRVMTPSGEGVEPIEGTELLVAYYANSIRHHLERADAVAAAAAPVG